MGLKMVLGGRSPWLRELRRWVKDFMTCELLVLCAIKLL
jgi:hypothetical protein